MASAIERLLNELNEQRKRERDRERETGLACSLYKAGVTIEQLVKSLAIPEAEIRAACGLPSE